MAFLEEIARGVPGDYLPPFLCRLRRPHGRGWGSIVRRERIDLYRPSGYAWHVWGIDVSRETSAGRGRKCAGQNGDNGAPKLRQNRFSAGWAMYLYSPTLFPRSWRSLLRVPDNRPSREGSDGQTRGRRDGRGCMRGGWQGGTELTLGAMVSMSADALEVQLVMPPKVPEFHLLV